MAEYGIFTDEGCIEAGFITQEAAEAHRVAEYPKEDAHVGRMCDDHEEQEAETCEECATEEEEESEEEEENDDE